MPILKTITAGNNSINGYHVVRSVEIRGIEATATVNVAAYPSEAVYVAGGPSLWSEPVPMPLDRIAQPIMDTIEQWLLANDYSGGTQIADHSIGLDGLQVRKWAEVKNQRQAAFDAPLVTPFGTFDSDSESRDSIKEGVLLVNNLVALGMPSDIRFTLADDTRITLTSAQMIGVGLLLGQKIQAAYDTSDTLRTAIFATDATAAGVAAVTWPVDSPIAEPAPDPAPAP